VAKVSVIGTIKCKEGKAEDMAAVLTQMVEAARGEPGVEVYSYHQGPDDTFWFFALMSDETAMRNHGRGEAMQAAMAAFGPLAAGTPQMTTTIPVAAVGLDL